MGSRPEMRGWREATPRFADAFSRATAGNRCVARPFALSAPELQVARTALTDADGRYDFRDLPAGRYSITASKPSFVSWSYGQTLPDGLGRPLALSDNQTADNVDVRLIHGAVITGRIVDEFGEPVPNAAVTALRRQYQQGQTRLVPSGERAQANDIGEYRIFGLAPGRYYVSATVQALTLAMPVGNSVEVSGQNSGYAPTFYPGTSDAASAQKVTVGGAQTLSGVDIALTPTRLATITGSAVDSEGRPMAGSVFATPRGNGAGHWSSGALAVRSGRTARLPFRTSRRGSMSSALMLPGTAECVNWAARNSPWPWSSSPATTSPVCGSRHLR